MFKSTKWLVLVLLLAFAFLRSEARADSLVVDPVGDTFGSGAVQHDITSINATYNSTTLNFTVNFAGNIFAPSLNKDRSVFGFIDLDVDRNPLTGAQSNTAIFGPPPLPNLGAEFGIDLFGEEAHPGFVDVFSEVSGYTVGTAPITFSATSFSVAVPLNLIGGNGLVNYAAIFGTFSEATDKVTNGNIPATSAAIPEPATLILLGTGLTSIGGMIRRRRLG